MALHEAKLAARTRVLAARDAMSLAQRSSAAAAIILGLTALPSYQRARVPLLTLPFRSEWDTLPLVRHALAAGKMVALPRVDTKTRMLVLHRIDDEVRDIEAGYRGIPEPLASCPRIDAAAIDWVLVPGVAFDREGRRLGYGGGFYDRLLSLIGRAVPRVAGAYALQVTDGVPSAPHDARIDTLVTPAQTLVIGDGRE
ncbi:MAG: 5-formyltetrahydrofolate cyclo-ligase [Betaproteobacteria bacterium]